jgi:indolepyruvate ferredoxin oxidoreductase beta subunit
MIAGVGGQGAVLASKLIAAAAMKSGFDVRTAETIGMAQRGGSVISHIRIGDNIFSPLIPLQSADALIAFEPAEAVRQLPYLRREKSTGNSNANTGILLVCDRAIKPAVDPKAGEYEAAAMIEYLKANVQKLVVIDGQRLTAHNAKTLNVAMLGAAVKCGIFPFNEEAIKEALAEMLPERLLEINLKAFESGKGE